MTSNFFETSNGNKVEMNNAWFEAKPNWPYGIDNIEEFVERVHEGDAEYPVNFGFFLNKLITFNYFYEFIKETIKEKKIKFDRALDIGTGPAIKPRLMKATGLVNEVYGIDKADRSNEYTNKKFRNYMEYIKNNLVAEENGKKILHEITETLGTLLGKYYPLHVQYTLYSEENSCELDEYITGDFFNYNSNDKFDLITAFMCIEYFDIKKLFNKIEELLTDDGVFFVIVDNWYDVWGGSMELPMDSPWLHARVNKHDLKRYYEEMRPDIASYAKKCIYFGTSHMSAADYQEYAKETGLNVEFYRNSLKKGIVNRALYSDSSFTEYFYNIVLEEAKEINPNVEITDLFTRYHIMLITKN